MLHSNPIQARLTSFASFLFPVAFKLRLVKRLVRELQAIECWLQLNSLFILINITKTDAMLFGTSLKLAKINRFSVTINVILDEHLSWDEHVKAIASKAGRGGGGSVCWVVFAVTSLFRAD